MKKYNIVMVYNKEETKILMCYRKRDPFKDKYNFVGGKLYEGENELVGAYRELEEETGITNNDIVLNHLMNFDYIYSNMQLQVFIGKLNKEVELIEEDNKLYWIDINENFFDSNKYAGNGNLGHILLQAKVKLEEEVTS